MVLDGLGDRAALFRAVAEAAAGRLSGEGPDRLFEVLEEREQRYPTSTPEGVAFPHAMIAEIEQTLLLPVLAKPAVSFGVQGHPPSDVVFAIFGAESKPFQHVQLLARLARVVRTAGALDRLRSAGTGAELVERLIDEDRAHA